ncbi:MAG: Hsp20/alpha crystallin family protein [Acidimicrobiales bacterium]
MVLFQNDPFRDVEALLDRAYGRQRTSGGARTMLMDAYRRGSDVWVHLDLPGVMADSIDISLERNVLTVTAARDWIRNESDQVYIGERPQGTFSRQVHLGDSLDADHIEADYHNGVLTLRLPIAEQAQPRKIAINAPQPDAIDVTSSDS